MEKSGQTGDGTLEHFNNYKYAPSRPQTQQSHTIFAISTTNGSGGAYNGRSHSIISENNSVFKQNGYLINKNTTNDCLPVADC